MNQIEWEYREAMDDLRFSDKEKERMMKNLMESESQNKKRKRLPVRGMLLAAALAVGCVLSIAASLPAQVYNFMSGGTFTTAPGMGQILIPEGEESVPIKKEDERLWFAAGGQKLDITDKVDESTPYIYEHTDAATGQKGYVVVGGTVNDFGWVEIVLLGETRAMSGYNYSTVSLVQTEEDGEIKYGSVDRNKLWFQAALDQLGIEG